ALKALHGGPYARCPVLRPRGRPAVPPTGVLILFFFSSRRRHTRSLRDWSSDVCSSDLELSRGQPCDFSGIRDYQHIDEAGGIQRSEERRVGKSVDLGGGRII